MTEGWALFKQVKNLFSTQLTTGLTMLDIYTVKSVIDTRHVKCLTPASLSDNIY